MLQINGKQSDSVFLNLRFEDAILLILTVRNWKQYDYQILNRLRQKRKCILILRDANNVLLILKDGGKILVILKAGNSIFYQFFN